MNETVALVPKDIAETQALSKTLAASSLLPQALRKKPEDVLAIVLAGAELGLAPMQAVRAINIIEGKLSMAADLMGALVLRSSVCEYLTCAETTGKVATYKTKRKGSPEETKLSFTIEQAKAAGLEAKANWKKYPDAMLRARAQAAICRMVYPDLCLGLYDPDEIGEPAPRVVGEGSTQSEHVAQVKEDLRKRLAPEPEDAVVVEADFAAEPWIVRIRETKSAAELQALVPELQKESAEIRAACKPVFLEQKKTFAG